MKFVDQGGRPAHLQPLHLRRCCKINDERFLDERSNQRCPDNERWQDRGEAANGRERRTAIVAFGSPAAGTLLEPALSAASKSRRLSVNKLKSRSGSISAHQSNPHSARVQVALSAEHERSTRPIYVSGRSR
jgi:hypothetical protein